MSKESDISILDELRRIGGGYEFSFAATYNAYFPFYEEVILRRLTSAGCRANTLVMDGRQCAAAFATDGSRPRHAGREYTLIPVRAGGAFHPKLLLLVGKRKGLLFVGSHNLTVAGFSHNRELTCRYEVKDESDSTELATFGRAWSFLQAWTAEQPEELLVPFGDAEHYANWLRDARSSAESVETQTTFIGASPDGQILWDLVRPQIPSGVKRITVVAPFFDGRLEFLKRLLKDTSPEELIVGIEPETVEINHEACRIMPPEGNVRFVDAKRLREDKGYLHAKAILIETAEGRELLITGSANASRQAWLAKPSERNAEAITITESSNKQSPAKALGLKALAKENALPADSWQEIKRQVASRAKREETTVHHTPLVAVETEGGFEIGAKLVREEITSRAELIDTDGNGVGSFTVALDENGFYQIDVPEIDARRQAATIALETSDGSSLIAIAHHTFDVVVSAQTERQRDLRHALSNLDAAAPMLEDMLRIVERVIFDDFDNYQTLPSGGGRGVSLDAGTPDSSNEPQSTFSASLKDSPAFRRRTSSALSSDDLALLLDALNKRLGVGLEASLGTSPAIARSEEELIGVDEDETEDFSEVDGYTLAKLCQRKTATMMRRMTAQLEIAAQDEPRSIGVVRQLAAVLGILHRLREVEQVAEWIPYDETLIRDKDEWKFFLNITRLLYSQNTPVMKRAVDAYNNVNKSRKTTGLAETSVAAGLLLWLAWDCALDVRSATEPEDHYEQQENLRGVARLVAMASHVCNDRSAQQKAHDAISHLCVSYISDGVIETWYEEHLSWLRKISAISLAPKNVPTLKRMADAGDLVYPVLKATLQPCVVLQSTGSSVKVVDLDKENEQNIYGAKYVAVINC